ncbi:PD40 domain-containing protein [candidate division KSB1 bacterium]|nr:PD40 domain-containing protein [candidate division KSB1 bacterium]
MIGKIYSHYHILKKIGIGGMGVVYQAEDMVLKRLVALKFLPPDLIIDEEAKLRFIQEAQFASKLDHPNICTIYEAQASTDGQIFIAMSYCSGQTLRERIDQSGPLPLSDTLNIAMQIATGLQQAHAAGIIHRDIKPENIMITPAGLVKVMDFGLATLKQESYPPEQSGASQITSENVAAGTYSGIYGTESYMSPEQIERLTVDERTDIFSLGVVIYEMITGKKPFVGADNIAVMKSILNDNPPIVPIAARDQKIELNRILKKALSKSPRFRYQCMSELCTDIQHLQTSISGLKTHPSKRTKYLFVVFILMLILAIPTLLWFQFSSYQKREKFVHPASLKMVSIGTTSEIEDTPSFSPDGKKVMYSSRIVGEPVNFSVNWIKDLETGTLKKLTEWGAATSWSPDGSQVVYAHSGGIFIYDLASQKSTLITDFGTFPKWSPKGNAITFFSNTSGLASEESAIFLYDLNNAAVRQVSPANGLKYARPNWSPDGRWIICIAGEGSHQDIWLIEPATNKAYPISDTGLWINSPVWCPSGQFIYYLSNQNGTVDVWRVPVELKHGRLMGKPIQITTGLDIMNLEISPDGNKLIFSRNETKEQIWRIPFDGTPNPLNKAKLVMTNLKGTENMEVSPDGKQMILETTYAGARALMLKSLVDNTEKILYQDQNVFAPTWSADGRWIAFDAGGGNQADIWRISADGGMAEKIISSQFADWSPTYSPDGNYLCFISNRSGHFNLWIHDIKAGKDTQITRTPNSKSRGFWSHDSKKLAYFENCDGENCCRIFCYDFASRESDEIFFIPDRRAVITDKLAWKADDSALYYLLRAWLPLSEVSIETKKVKTVLNFKQGELTPGGNRVFTVHENFFYFISTNEASDIWIAEGLR